MKIGFFGKLPGYGDFVQRNVAPDFINQWDNWLRQSLETSREQLGNQWQARYFNSPIWRFVIAQSALNGATTSGLMMPSVDKSGRCYPFTVICQTEVAVNPFIFARQVDPLHQNGEDFILSLLEKKRPDLDEVCEVLNSLYAPIKEPFLHSVNPMNTTSVMELAAMTEVDLNDFSRCNDSFLQTLVDRQNIHISIWSMGSAVGANAQKRYFSGMPPTDNYHSLLVAEGLE